MQEVNGQYSLNGRVLCRIVEDEAVLLDLDFGQYYGLNSVGTRIWQLLGDGHSPSSICDHVVREFKVSEGEAVADVEALIETLLARRLLVRQMEPRATG